MDKWGILYAVIKHLPWQILSFARWRIDHPEGTVITLKTGHRRDYRRNPYADYFATERLMFPVSREDVRLPPKARVIGVKSGAVTKAYPIEQIASAPGGQVEDSIDGKVIVLKAERRGQTVQITQLPEKAQAVHTFWFAWAAFHPETRIYSDLPANSASSSTQPAGP